LTDLNILARVFHDYNFAFISMLIINMNVNKFSFCHFLNCYIVNRWSSEISVDKSIQMLVPK